MNIFLDVLKILAGFTGLGIFAYKIYIELKGYVRTSVKVIQNDNPIQIFTEIENSSRKFKRVIDNAFVIVSPELEDILVVGQKINNVLKISNTICKTNDFENFKLSEPTYIDNCIVIIPLQFYFSENIQIGDETLTYSCSLNRTLLEKGNYSVRFYIFGESRLHRSTQALLVIK
ncbi:MAG: hypothetical protein NTW25_06615 [Candidatus Kapabacteria bacterium]|nr:hypothetical protein [Candidatus Kapabacteria bacterium]